MKRHRTKWYRRCLPSVLFLILCAGVLFWLGWLLVQPWTEPPGDPAPEPESTSHLIIITPTPAPIDQEEALVQAVMTRDDEAGGEIECEVDYNDLLNLSRIMAAESGPNWPDWAIMAVGEVVLNRCESPEFPDTIWGVLSQRDPVQYEPVYQNNWVDIRPDEQTVRLAMKLLQGERVLNDPCIVFQALFPQGEYTVVTYYDADLDTTTYFCRTNNPELYDF